MSPLSPVLALIAGVLTVFSPCVLPLLPIIFGSAAARHRWAPAALAGGLAASFTLVGLAVAALGAQASFDPQIFKSIGGAIMLVLGLVMVTPVLSRRVAVAGGPLVDWGQSQLARFDAAGVWEHALLGGLLGLVWSPCVGPTLGAASLLAAQGRNLGQVALVMGVFGLGSAGALALIGYAARHSYAKWKSKLRFGGAIGRIMLGGSLFLIGVLMVTGLDRIVETALVQASPDWLTRLISRY